MKSKKGTKPWKCRLFGCDWGTNHLHMRQITDSLAVLSWTCIRCGEKTELLMVNPSDDAVRRYYEAEGRGGETSGGGEAVSENTDKG